jgi:hypothetical protein
LIEIYYFLMLVKMSAITADQMMENYLQKKQEQRFVLQLKDELIADLNRKLEQEQKKNAEITSELNLVNQLYFHAIMKS